jgi:arylsulfatase A-like enzyme
LSLWSCRGKEAREETGGKVILFGVDGASWVVMEPLLEAGELPAFRRMMDEGAWMPDFATIGTTHSPLVWTTVATGRKPRDHGITDYVEKLANGDSIPVSSNSRKAKAIWELTGEHGRTAGVLGWWASWPAEQIPDYVVTDHANPLYTALMFGEGHYWTADPEAMRQLQSDFWPADLAPILGAHWIDTEQFPYEEFEKRSGLSPEQMAAVGRAPFNRRRPYSILKTFYAIDYPLFRAAQQLARERPVDLQMLYVRGPDPIQHYAWDTVEPEKFARKPPNLARDRGIVDGVYRYVDSMLAEILESRDPDTWVIVASDHGGEPAKDAADPKRKGRPGIHGNFIEGVLFIIGPHVKPGHRIQAGNPGDLMPTMAWLLGLPLSEELMGGPLTEAFDEQFVAEHEPVKVASYGERETTPGMASPADEALMEQLKALGYVD